MKISIKCFSFVRYALDQKKLVLDLEDGTTTESLEKIVREMANGKLDDIILRTAVNQSYTIKSIELKNSCSSHCNSCPTNTRH